MRRACLVDEQKCTLTGHSGRVLSVAYSPDGKQIASGSDDNTVKVWDVLARQVTGQARVAVHADGA